MPPVSRVSADFPAIVRQAIHFEDPALSIPWVYPTVDFPVNSIALPFVGKERYNPRLCLTRRNAPALCRTGKRHNFRGTSYEKPMPDLPVLPTIHILPRSSVRVFHRYRGFSPTRGFLYHTP